MPVMYSIHTGKVYDVGVAVHLLHGARCPSSVEGHREHNREYEPRQEEVANELCWDLVFGFLFPIMQQQPGSCNA
jgi:hypothetical protein